MVRAAVASGGAAGAGGLRRKIARPAGTLARLLAAPFVAAAAALSGLLFVILLPICGIASIAEGIARASWGWVRRAVARREGP